MSMSDIDTIQEHLSQAEVLAQLAEEAAELSKAALKLRRAYTGCNPTPVTSKEAFENLLEELADIQVCIAVLGFDRGTDRMEIGRIMNAKMERWAGRLEKARTGRINERT